MNRAERTTIRGMTGFTKAPVIPVRRQRHRARERILARVGETGVNLRESSTTQFDQLDAGNAVLIAGGFAFTSEQPVTFILPSNPELETRVQVLEQEVAELKKRLAIQEEGEVTVIRDIPREQVKEEIRALFQAGDTLYYSDIVRSLGLDISLVVELCDELESEGEVETLGDSARSR